MKRVLGTLGIGVLLLVCVLAILFVSSRSESKQSREELGSSPPALEGESKPRMKVSEIEIKPRATTPFPSREAVEPSEPPPPETTPELKSSLEKLIEAMKKKNYKKMEAILRTLGRDALPDLLSFLLSREYGTDMKLRILRAVNRFRSPDALPALVQLVEGDNPLVLQQEAVVAIAAIGTEQALRTLVDILKRSKKAEVKRAVADALVRSANEKTLTQLVELFKSEQDVMLREIIRLALINSPTEGVIKKLGELFGYSPENEPELIALSASALAEIGTQDAMEILFEAIRTDPSSVRAEEALDALTEIAEVEPDVVLEKALQLLQSNSIDVRESAIELLASTGDQRAIEPLLKLLSDPDPDIRATTAEYLADLDFPEVVNGLIEALGKEEDTDVKETIIESIGFVGNDEVVSQLAQLLNSEEDEDVRITIIEALGDIASEKAIPILLQILKSDEDTELKVSAIESLGFIGDKDSVPALLELYNQTTDSDIRLAIVQAFGDIGDPSALPQLETLLSNPSEEEWVRRSAAFSIAQIAEERALPILTKAFENSVDDRSKLAIVEGLMYLDDNETVREYARTQLKDYLGGLALRAENKRIRMRALSALATLIGSDAIDIIQESINTDPEPRVRAHAQRLLVRLKAQR